MLSEFHLLRPYWLLVLPGLIAIAWQFMRRSTDSSAWANVCDEAFLPHLMKTSSRSSYFKTLLPILGSAAWMVIALSGPTWSRYPTPTYQNRLPRVVVLNLSDNMLEDDLSPNRLERAKFKLHDLFQKPDPGQLGLIVYTQEAFVISPLTEDAKTIDALLPFLNPDIVPIQGDKLDLALQEADEVIKQAGFQSGQILVMTASPPSKADIATARILARRQINTSIIPFVAEQGSSNKPFQQLAEAGHGEVISLRDTTSDLDHWLSQTNAIDFEKNADHLVSIWRDQGLWFLIPALLFLLPVFQRGWITRLRP